jgi:molybdate transport system substrate-binding protein
MLLRLAIPLLALLAVVSGCARDEDQTIVLAASSLQEAMEEIAEAWEEKGNDPVVLSFAGSASLARQIQNGAPADIFISADEDWMNALSGMELVRGEPHILASNRLVLIAPGESPIEVDLDNPRELLLALPPGSRVAMGEPETVPAGRYAKAALESLGLWPSLRERIAPTDNVRAALALVEAGEAPLGIVYASDAMVSDRVRVVAPFPPESHPPIHYPAALLGRSPDSEARDFLGFLQGDEAQAVFARYGFVRP